MNEKVKNGDKVLYFDHENNCFELGIADSVDYVENEMSLIELVSSDGGSVSPIPVVTDEFNTMVVLPEMAYSFVSKMSKHCEATGFFNEQ